MIDNYILSHTQHHLQTESNLSYLMQSDIRKQSPHTDVETKHSVTLSKQTLHSHPTQKNVDSRKYFLFFFLLCFEKLAKHPQTSPLWMPYRFTYSCSLVFVLRVRNKKRNKIQKNGFTFLMMSLYHTTTVYHQNLLE